MRGLCSGGHVTDDTAGEELRHGQRAPDAVAIMIWQQRACLHILLYLAGECRARRPAVYSQHPSGSRPGCMGGRHTLRVVVDMG